MMLHSHKSMAAALFAGLMLAGALLAPVAQAAEKKDKAAKRMQQMVQKLKQEKAELQSQFDLQKADLEGKIKLSEEQTGALKASLGGAQRKSRVLEAELKALRDEKLALETRQQQTEATLRDAQVQLEKAQKSLADLTQQHQIAQHDLKVGEGERKTLSTNLAQKEKNLGVCEEKNAKLHSFGLELIKIYDKPSTYEAVLRTEPFTQIKRVELENILQDYRDKLDEQRVSTVTP